MTKEAAIANQKNKQAINDLLFEYKEALDAEKEAKTKKETISALLKEEMTNEEITEYFINDKKVATLYETPKNTFDKKGLAKEIGQKLIDKYTTVSTSIGLRVTM